MTYPNHAFMKPTSLFTVLLALSFGNAAIAESSKTIPNFAAANLVLGKQNFTGTNAGATSGSKFSSSVIGDVVVDQTTRKVFVADGFRVLRFANADALANGAAAEAVFGQGNFTDVTGTTITSDTRFSVIGIDVDTSGNLWVADVNNCRVLCFSNASSAGNFPAASRVFGQSSFTTRNPQFDATGMAYPLDVTVDAGGNLWVADAGNNRVLRFNGIANKSSGAAADGVLGQTTLATVGGGPEGLSQSKFDSPQSIAVSASGSLFVSDGDNNRVLRFDNAATLGNGVNASIVLGQGNFTSAVFDTSANRMDKPDGLSIAADDTLWVADRYNQRVLRFDNASTLSTSADANGVLGQPDFFSKGQNNNTQGEFSENSQGFLFPEHLFVDDVKGGVWVSDSQNSRVIRFGGADQIKPALTANAPRTTKLAKLTIKGTASDAGGVAKLQYRLGKGALKNAKGTTKWEFKVSLNVGNNTITIIATDRAGNTTSKTIKIKRNAAR